jgi:hypothetical protein
MHYDFIAIPHDEMPQAVDPLFQHFGTTYASEADKTASMWPAIPDDLLNDRPHEKISAGSPNSAVSPDLRLQPSSLRASRSGPPVQSPGSPTASPAR